MSVQAVSSFSEFWMLTHHPPWKAFLQPQIFITLENTSGHDEVFVSRIRRDFSIKNGLNIWVVADNIRKGVASNAVQILEKLL